MSVECAMQWSSIVPSLHLEMPVTCTRQMPVERHACAVAALLQPTIRRVSLDCEKLVLVGSTLNCAHSATNHFFTAPGFLAAAGAAAGGAALPALAPVPGATDTSAGQHITNQHLCQRAHACRAAADT